MARILTSPDFNVPERLRGFLTFVVEEFLAGRGNRIKAYAIATDVFGRSHDFDVQNDPVVRIEAGRLRRALERYYLTGGRTDPIVIDIPKGGYAPDIRRRCRTGEPALDVGEAVPIQEPTLRNPEESPAWKHRPRLLAAVLCAAVALGIIAIWVALSGRGSEEPGAAASPEVNLVVASFANLSGPDGVFYSAGISDELLSQLARFKELRVIHRDSAKVLGQVASGSSTSGGLQYFLEGSVRVAGQNLRVSSRLIDGRTAEILWSQVYDRDLRGFGSLEIEADIAAKVATAVAQPYGAIFSPVSLEASARVPAGAKAYLCVLRFYQYRREPTRDEHRLTRNCLQETVAQNPSYSTGWAMLAYLYLDEDRFEFNQQQQAPAGKMRAREAAERAVRIDASNVRALQALMVVLFYSKEPETALKLGEQALALNPNDTEIMAELGSRIAQFGDRKRGLAMIEESIERNPNQSRYFIAILAQNYYMLGDNARALHWIRRADMKRFSNYHFVAALIFARANLHQEAEASAREFLRLRPRFFENLEAEIAMRNYNAQDRRLLIEGAREAGFPIGETYR